MPGLIDRRSFLKWVGIGAAGILMPVLEIIEPAPEVKVFDMGRSLGSSDLDEPFMAKHLIYFRKLDQRVLASELGEPVIVGRYREWYRGRKIMDVAVEPDALGFLTYAAQAPRSTPRRGLRHA